jgi:PadR family transcriptional regulator PadR
MRNRFGCQEPPCGGVRPRRIRRFVEPALLLLLHDQPTHGYALMEGLTRLGLDTYPVDQSVVYRILRDLEEAGVITSEWETEDTGGPPRRVYKLTQQGHEHLKAWVEELRATDHILHLFLEAYDQHMEHGEGVFHPENISETTDEHR